jgi:hypothetical protein
MVLDVEVVSAVVAAAVSMPGEDRFGSVKGFEGFASEGTLSDSGRSELMVLRVANLEVTRSTHSLTGTRASEWRLGSVVLESRDQVDDEGDLDLSDVSQFADGCRRVFVSRTPCPDAHALALCNMFRCVACSAQHHGSRPTGVRAGGSVHAEGSPHGSEVHGGLQAG